MSFTPKTDADTGTIFSGFTSAEATKIVEMMNDTTGNWIYTRVTEKIQMGHYYNPQKIVEEVIAGNTFTIDFNTSSYVYHTSNLLVAELYANGIDRMYACQYTADKFSQLTTERSTFVTSYSALENQLNSLWQQYAAGTITYQEYDTARQIVWTNMNTTANIYKATLDTIMVDPVASDPTSNIYFDNKRRMLYIDGKYYNTTYIGGSEEE